MGKHVRVYHSGKKIHADDISADDDVDMSDGCITVKGKAGTAKIYGSGCAVKMFDGIGDDEPGDNGNGGDMKGKSKTTKPSAGSQDSRIRDVIEAARAEFADPRNKLGDIMGLTELDFVAQSLEDLKLPCDKATIAKYAPDLK